MHIEDSKTTVDRSLQAMLLVPIEDVTDNKILDQLQHMNDQNLDCQGVIDHPLIPPLVTFGALQSRPLQVA